MIEKLDFMPAMDEEGKLLLEERTILVKASGSGLAYVEFINGDEVNEEWIQQKLNRDHQFLSGIEGRGRKCFYEIFIFENTPEPSKLEEIIGGQHKEVRENTNLGCITIELSTGSVNVHFKPDRWEKAMERLLEQAVADRVLVDYSELVKVSENKKKEFEFQFSGKRPVVTYGLIAINILVFAVFYLYSQQSGKSYDDLIFKYGAKVNEKLLSGEFFRFITPIFLHGSPTHLLVNCYSLYAVGTSVEAIFGRRRFLAVYFAAGILGNICSFCFSPNWGIGASGAIFGLLGALIYFSLMKPALFRRFFGNQIWIVIVINLGYGFSNSGIDNFAHLGGLAGGFIAAGLVAFGSNEKWYLNKALYAVLLLAVFGCGLLFGFNNSMNNVQRKVSQLTAYEDAKNWKQAAEEAKSLVQSNAGGMNRSTKIQVLWVLVSADVNLGMYQAAVPYAKQVEQLDAGNGHYLLGVLYYNLQQFDLARQNLQAAKKAGMTYPEIDTLLSALK